MDLVAISQYIVEKDSLEKADRFLRQLREQLEKLTHYPNRGVVPRELSEMDVHDEFREILFKSHRIIHEVVESTVYIYMIVDGRRDMKTLLRKRLLRA